MEVIEQKIVSDLNLKDWQVKNVLQLTDDDNTVHFIARYRKEKTGNLDENVIREIISLRDKFVLLEKTRESAIKNISEQGKLTDELQQLLNLAKTIQEIDDIYVPFKRKKKTKADIAREKGFDCVARLIKSQERILIPKELLEKFTEEEIILGAQDIVSQEIADNPKLKEFVRKEYLLSGTICSEFTSIEKWNDKQEKESYKFKIYSAFDCALTKLKSYQILALNRGETLGILKVGLVKSEMIFRKFTIKNTSSQNNIALLEPCIKEGYSKIFNSIEREIRGILTERASVEAIQVFQDNLKNLLLLKPHYGESLLAIDPGFRTGCKICILDKNSSPVEFSKIYLEDKEKAILTLRELLSKHNPDKIVLGNGTASDDTYELILKNFNIEPVLVNESGASVYSTSEIGGEEFPKLDATDRGTISIGRRYIDCLSELVKVPVNSIGVGMYQHDMNQKELEKKLTDTIEDVVNLVGINVNSASVYLLKNVSGLTKTTAKKIFTNRPYKSREELRKILSAKTYQQAIGFLRVPESPEKLDNTAIHPEQYEVARFIVSKNGLNIYNEFETELKKIFPDITPETVADIQKAYSLIGVELRQHEGSLKKASVVKIEDLKINDIISGVIRNVTQFGAFVDIGLKNNALIHISELSNSFVKNPLDVVSIGQEVRGRIIKIDLENGKVGLSLK